MRARHLVHGLAFLLLASLGVSGLAAEPARSPSAFITETVYEALGFANSKTLSSADREQRLGSMLDQNFDLPLIATYVLGDYWQKASQTEQQNFIEVFRDFVLRIYSQSFTGYDSKSFRIVGQRTESATRTVVYTEISRPASTQPVRMAWEIADQDGYRIIDMSVSSVSMARTKRHEFASYLRRANGDLSMLIQQLK